MDWDFAIEKHRGALKRVLAALASMAGLAGPHPEVRAAGELRRTLPRHLHRAVLRLLRPAEAAARRLIIVAARDIVVAPPSPCSAWSPSPASQGMRSRFAEGNSVVPLARSKAGGRRDAAKQLGPGRKGTAGDGGGGIARPARINFPLLDPLRRRSRQLRASRVAMPRICVPGWSEPAPLPPKPEPHDAIDARRLVLRLAALSRALDDLPREARRFARWHARNRASFEGEPNGNVSSGRRAPRRVWPLRFGRPPGQRPGSSRRPAHEIHQILDDLHGLANWVLEAPDTS